MIIILISMFCRYQCNIEKLSKRGGKGCWDTDSEKVKASEKASVLLMELPINL